MNQTKFREYFMQALLDLGGSGASDSVSVAAYDKAIQKVEEEQRRMTPATRAIPDLPTVPQQSFQERNPLAKDITAEVEAAGGIENYVRDLACDTVTPPVVEPPILTEEQMEKLYKTYTA